MARSVSRRLPPLHEDWAIISIQPLPAHEITFPAVRDVVREYLVEHRRLGVRDIQRSHLGQVLVQFSSVLERDNLVLLGPQQYLDATFTAQRHNDAWNHRALFFNREC
jgi:phage-related baseplate assembly protein